LIFTRKYLLQQITYGFHNETARPTFGRAQSNLQRGRGDFMIWLSIQTMLNITLTASSVSQHP